MLNEGQNNGKRERKKRNVSVYVEWRKGRWKKRMKEKRNVCLVEQREK